MTDTENQIKASDLPFTIVEWDGWEAEVHDLERRGWVFTEDLYGVYYVYKGYRAGSKDFSASSFSIFIEVDEVVKSRGYKYFVQREHVSKANFQAPEYVPLVECLGKDDIGWLLSLIDNLIDSNKNNKEIKELKFKSDEVISNVISILDYFNNNNSKGKESNYEYI